MQAHPRSDTLSQSGSSRPCQEPAGEDVLQGVIVQTAFGPFIKGKLEIFQGNVLHGYSLLEFTLIYSEHKTVANY